MIKMVETAVVIVFLIGIAVEVFKVGVHFIRMLIVPAILFIGVMYFMYGVYVLENPIMYANQVFDTLLPQGSSQNIADTINQFWKNELAIFTK